MFDYEDVAPNKVQSCADQLGNHGYQRDLHLDQKPLGEIKLRVQDATKDL
jgi:hypothetical protein